MDFYNRLNYSLGNEDWFVEEQALRVNPGDRAICVTASGDRALHLLMTDCTEVISIDMNKIQNCLLELKLASIKQLDFDKYLAFLGCESTTHRQAIYQELKPHLSPDAVQYWDKNKKMIERGIAYQGMIERLTLFVSQCFKLFRRKKIKTLLSFTDIDAQREFVTKEWDTFLLRQTFNVILNSNMLKLVLNDPGLNSYIDKSIHPGNYIYQRMQNYLSTQLARKSSLLQLMINGRLIPDAYFPYLTLDGYTKIRRNMERLTFHTDNIIEYLNERPLGKFNCFSLSDIASYMPQPVFEKLLQGILNAAQPGARFCLREFMSKRTIPDNLLPHFKRDSVLEKELEDKETNFVYRFIAGDIQK